MSTIGIYDYNMAFYTDNKSQPNAMTVFVKSEDGKKSIHRTKFPVATWMGITPIVSTFTGVARIVNATKTIFKEVSKMELKKDDPHLCESWNAFKNLFRGLVEIVPLVGNISLIIFDSVRAAIYFGKVLKSLENQNSVCGVALDGKVIFQMDLETVKKLKEDASSDQKCLDSLDAFCTESLKSIEKKAKEQGKTIHLPDALKLFPSLVEKLISNKSNNTQ